MNKFEIYKCMNRFEILMATFTRHREIGHRFSQVDPVLKPHLASIS